MSGLGPVRYVDLGGVGVGYRIQGAGPPLLNVGNWLTNADAFDFVPALQRYTSMSSFAEVAFLDMPGSGSSDGILGAEIGNRADWVRAFDVLLDELGWESASLVGWDMATHPILAYAAARPGRVERVILLNPLVRAIADDQLSVGMDPADVDAYIDGFMALYGTPQFLKVLAASGVADEASCEGWARWQRASAPPGRAKRLQELLLALSSVDLLGDVRVPTTVIESRHDSMWGRQGRFITDEVTGAEYLELPYEDFFPVAESDMASLLGEVEHVLTGARRRRVTRQLLAVLFSDIVSSTEQAVAVGDRRWRELIAGHRRIAVAAVERAGGRYVKSTGDGTLAVFPSISGALHCAAALHDAASREGLSLRIGVHAGDVELVDDDIAGVAVHIAARVQAHAPAGSTGVSAVTAALVTDEAFGFEEFTTASLKGVPGQWPLVLVSRSVPA